jgi:2-aminoethylphosphonate-pyruvate transaminase
MLQQCVPTQRGLAKGRKLITTAVILAAGRGTRLGEEFKTKPKGLLEVGGQSLISRSLGLLESVGIDRIILGTGHCAHHYDTIGMDRPTVECHLNAEYATSGSMQTLAGLRDLLDEDFLLLESDLIYERFALISLLERTECDVILASAWTGSSDEVYIETNAEGLLVDMSKDAASLRSLDAELVGISKLSIGTYSSMCDAVASKCLDEPFLDYEYGLVEASSAASIYVHREEHLAWGEIDDASHLERVERDVMPLINEHDRRTNTLLPGLRGKA